MATEKSKAQDANELSVEERLRTLYELQVVDSEIDKIITLRGELPLEVQDLEDEIEGSIFKELLRKLYQTPESEPTCSFSSMASAAEETSGRYR